MVMADLMSDVEVGWVPISPSAGDTATNISTKYLAGFIPSTSLLTLIDKNLYYQDIIWEPNPSICSPQQRASTPSLLLPSCQSPHSSNIWNTPNI